jgi:hypothetical protein
MCYLHQEVCIFRGALKRAVAGGNAEAVEYFANLWPALKERSDRNFE